MARPARILVAALALVLAQRLPEAHGALEPRLDAMLEARQPDDEVSVIAVLSAQADLAPFDRAVRDAERMSAAARRVHRGALISALKETAAASAGTVSDFLRARGARNLEPLWIVNAIGVTAAPEVIQALAALPGVAEVRLNGMSRIPDTAVAPAAAEQWNLAAVGAPELWGLGFTGAGVVVATLDSGVDLLHADLAPRWRGGSNSWLDPYGEHPLAPHDADGHGTAVMGVLVGGDASGTAIGMAPGAWWIAAKIFNDDGVAEDLAIHQAFQWLLDPDGDPDTDDAPDVLNASWDLAAVSGACDTRFQPDVQALRAAGVAVVFAAGNTGPLAGSSTSPASYSEAFAAGSVGPSLNVSAFSARGPSACDGTVFPEVAAPGESIRTADLTLSGAFPSATVPSVSGTSLAAPHVAGAMALLLSALPGRSAAALEAALRWTAADVAPVGADNGSGSGLIDVPAAYRYLDVPPATPLIAVLPSAAGHNFGKVPPGSVASASFSVVNAGSTDLLLGTVAIAGANAGDFGVSADLCSGAPLAPSEACTFDVGFAALDLGRKSAQLAIPSSDPSTPEVLVPLTANALTTVGTWRSGSWYLDDGDGAWNGALDTVRPRFGLSGDVPVTGDWDGDGVTQIGTWRRGAWYLDDGDGVWSAALDTVRRFGLADDVPVTGDWDGDGVTQIGTWRRGVWYLDDGDGVWNAALDTVRTFGIAGDVPVTGDWDGDGATQIGVWRSGIWYLDDGDGAWNAALDTVRTFGIAGDVPVSGDWNGDGITQIGTRRSGTWYLDDGDGAWNAALDTIHARFGLAGDVPVTGCWR